MLTLLLAVATYGVTSGHLPARPTSYPLEFVEAAALITVEDEQERDVRPDRESRNEAPRGAQPAQDRRRRRGRTR